MNNTATLRERLREHTGTFRAIDFADISSSHAIITKMVNSGEVLLVSYTRPKVYRVGKLKDHKPRLAPKAVYARKPKDEPVPLYVELWSKVYPELFKVPDFRGFKSTVRNNLQEI